MKRSDFVQAINPPKFRIGKFVFNEYEIREILAKVSEGKIDYNSIVIKDKNGNSTGVTKFGNLEKVLPGLNVLIGLKMRKLRAQSELKKKGA